MWNRSSHRNANSVGVGVPPCAGRSSVEPMDRLSEGHIDAFQIVIYRDPLFAEAADADDVRRPKKISA
jgi:hypothetical protein